MSQVDSGSAGQTPISPWTRRFAGDLLEAIVVAGCGLSLFWLLRPAVGGQDASVLVVVAFSVYLFVRFRAVAGSILMGVFAVGAWAVFRFLGSAWNHFLIVAAFVVAFAYGLALWHYRKPRN